MAVAESAKLSPETLRKCSRSSATVARTLFRDVFYAPLNSFHREIFDTIDAVDLDTGYPLHPKVVLSAPRGLGKSSCVGLAYAARQILFKQSEYMFYITASSSLAIGRTEILKSKLRTSRIVQETFGDIKSKRVTDCAEIDEDFAKQAWVAHLPYNDDPAYIGTRVVPRGAKQQIRSSGWDKARPDRIIGDDLDDPRLMKNEDLRKEIGDWWFADVLPCTSRYNQNNQFVYIGTMTHRDCLLARLMKLSTWRVIRLSVCDENFRTLDKDFLSQEAVDGLVAEYEEAGMLDVFRREYMNQDVSALAPAFSRDTFRYYEEGQDDLKNARGVENIILVDPAKTANFRGAHTAIVGVAVDRMKQAIYVRDVAARPMFPDEMYLEAIQMARRLGARVIACEVTGLQEFVSQPFKNAISIAGGGLVFEELHARAGQGEFAGRGMAKAGRVAGLVPFYRMGLIYHNARACMELEEQLLSYPDPKRWDIIDAFAYVTQMMERGQRYMTRPIGRDDPNRFGKALDRLKMQQGARHSVLRQRPAESIHDVVAA